MNIIVKIPITKCESVDDFTNKPLVYKNRAIGVIQSVNEIVDDCEQRYCELNVLVWERFAEVIPTIIGGKISGLSLFVKGDV